MLNDVNNSVIKKVIRKSATFIMLLMLLQFSCTEPFYPKISDGINVLVVDGKITNGQGFSEVKLFRTTPLHIKDTLVPEVGAAITLHDDKGNITPYTQISLGIYRTVDSVVGVIGNSYWIEIITSDGNKFESTPEIMPPLAEIIDIYGEEEEIVYGLDNVKKGVNFYFDAESASNNLHVRWEYDESWEWRDVTSASCFPVRSSGLVQIFDAKYLTETKINHLQSALVVEDEVKLKYNYALNIKLYSISEESYKFWNNLKNISRSIGGLYDVVPSNLQGNVQPCQENTLVVGYFEAASASQKSKIFDRTNFDIDFAQKDMDCEFVEIFTDEEIFQNYYSKYYNFISRKPVNGEWLYILIRKECEDCSFKYPVARPLFWK